jgi:hypothetical protein
MRICVHSYDSPWIADGLSSAYAIRGLIRLLTGERSTCRPFQRWSRLYIGRNSCLTTQMTRYSLRAPGRAGRHLPHGRRLTAPHSSASTESGQDTHTCRAGTKRTDHCSRRALLGPCARGRESTTSWNDSPVRVMSPFNLRTNWASARTAAIFPQVQLLENREPESLPPDRQIANALIQRPRSLPLNRMD